MSATFISPNKSVGHGDLTLDALKYIDYEDSER